MPHRRPLPADLQTDYGARWSEFGEVLDSISSQLRALPDHVSFRIEGPASGYVGLVTAPDLRRKFDNITWSLTSQAQDNGGVGQIKSTWDDPVRRTYWISGEQQTIADSFKTYALHPFGSGLIYLALHETAHVTDLGIRIWTESWNAHKDHGGSATNYPWTSEWKRNEMVANSIVRAVCLRLALPPLANINPGYLP